MQHHQLLGTILRQHSPVEIHEPRSLASGLERRPGSEGISLPIHTLVQVPRAVQGVESLLGRAFRGVDGDVHAVIHGVRAGEEERKARERGRPVVEDHGAFGAEKPKVLLAEEQATQDQIVRIVRPDELACADLDQR